MALTIMEGPSIPYWPLASTEDPSTPDQPYQEEEKETSTQDVPVPESPPAVRPEKRKRRPPSHLEDFVLG